MCVWEGGGYYPADAYRWPPGPGFLAYFTHPCFSSGTMHVASNGNSTGMSIVRVNSVLFLKRGGQWMKRLEPQKCKTIQPS